MSFQSTTNTTNIDTTIYSIHKNYDLIQDDSITQHSLLIPGKEMEISSRIHSVRLYSSGGDGEVSGGLEEDLSVSRSLLSSSILNSEDSNENETKENEFEKEMIKNVDHLFLLNNLLHIDECKRILNIEKTIPFESIHTEYPEEYRNSRRILFNDKELAQTLWRRMKKYLIKYSFVRPYGLDNGGNWKPIGINECMRLSRYEKGQYFKPHVDGQFVRNADERSVYTLLIYLNDGFRGGETRFVKKLNEEEVKTSKSIRKISRSDRKMSKKKFAKDFSALNHHKEVAEMNLKENSTLQYKHLCSISPKIGSASIFNHDLYHEGCPVTEGVKYILRTEIMFKRMDSNNSIVKKGADESKLYEHAMAILKQSDDLEKKGKLSESTDYYRKVQDLLILNGHSMSLLMVPNFQLKGNFLQREESYDNELTMLPLETLTQIFSYLNDWEICTLILPLDRYFHLIARDYHLWEWMYMKRWGNSITDLLKQVLRRKNSELRELNTMDNTTSIDETPHEEQDWYHIYIMKRYFEKEFEPVFLDIGFDRSNASAIEGPILNVKSLLHRPRSSQ